jgi:aminoglycoside phosphotransferase (APT) family kinase protein
MHVDEVDVDVSLMSRLLTAQFPQWADLPMEPVPSAGTDNALYRLGSDMAMWLPRLEGAIGQVDKEQQWLEGENATIERIVEEGQTARDLAHFITDLPRIDSVGGPPLGRPTFSAACRWPCETLPPAPRS